MLVILLLCLQVPHNVYHETDFKKKFKALVWSNYIEPDEFELSWKSLMEEFQLQDHPWLSTMFEIRDRWIPAYFRGLNMGLFLRTTSRSESENSAFGQFTNRYPLAG
jgi:hypothetical protein